MKTRSYLAGWLILLTAGFGGCESVRDSMRAQVTRTPIERLVAGDKAHVFPAADATLRALGNMIDRSSLSDGDIVARSSIYREGSGRQSLQRLWRVHVEDAFTGFVRVQVEVREAVEEEAGSGNPPVKTEQIIPESPAQRHFFEELEERLKQK